MPVFRTLLITTVLALGIESVIAAGASPADFESCRVINETQARLDCLKRLVSPAPSKPTASSEPDSPWPLVRTPRPGGAPSAIAVMRTPDTLRSDPDLAGLMIRCREKTGLEVVLALVRPFPPRSKKDVILTSGTAESTLKAETSDAGTGLVLPVDATMFTTGPWKESQELAVRIRDPEGDIQGVVPLAGAAQAIAVLSASCPPG
ncbi:hypothetical protein WI604_25750 [Bradyrhizobium symbiodeficiens]|uniref:hypothetical protein n=1 Tax=Bradyrhizobium symbiodeficiens TaxID=1404367 RepID=UPI0030CE94D2